MGNLFYDEGPAPQFTFERKPGVTYYRIASHDDVVERWRGVIVSRCNSVACNW